MVATEKNAFICLFVCLSYWILFFFSPPEEESLSSQEKKYDMKKELNDRWEELKCLWKEKGWVDSLLKLCAEVQHLVKGDAEKDLNARRGWAEGPWEQAATAAWLSAGGLSVTCAF